MKNWPWKIAYFSVFLTVLVVTIVTYLNWDNFKYLQELKEKNIPLIQDSGIIVKNDEILVNTLMLAVATKNIKKIEEYDGNKKKLVASIDHLMNFLTFNSDSEKIRIKRLDAFDLEDQVIRHIKNDEFNQANQILESPKYDKVLREFRAKILSQSSQLFRTQDQNLENRKEMAFYYSVIALIALLLIIVGWVFVLTTVNQNQKKMKVQEQEIQEQEQKAVNVSKLAALGEMAGGVAHEINNPLAIIQGYADMLCIRSQEEELKMSEVHELAELIKTTSERIAKIIKGLRYLARDGSSDPFENILLSNVIEHTLNLVSEKFKNNGVQLEVNLESMSGMQLSCREVQFSQIIVNLVNNAYDAVKTLDERWVKIWAEDFGDLFALNIEDSGSGIPPEIGEKIFQPFFTTKEVGHGTGLGLSISATIVKEHNGTLKIDQKSANTRFVILLPKLEEVAAHDLESNVA